MNGWYEWRANPDTPSGKKARKTPFFMTPGDDELICMAGLWSTWRPKDAAKDSPPLLSCTIITTDAVGPLAEIHDRMPLMIDERDWDRWLDPDGPLDDELLRRAGRPVALGDSRDLDAGEQRAQQRPGAHRAGRAAGASGDAALTLL